MLLEVWELTQRYPACFLNMWWTSKFLGWREKKKMYNIPNPLRTVFFLHHHSIPRKNCEQSILPHLFNAAKSCIPHLWKQNQPPLIAMWLTKVEDINRMEGMEDLIYLNTHENFWRSGFVGKNLQFLLNINLF